MRPTPRLALSLLLAVALAGALPTVAALAQSAPPPPIRGVPHRGPAGLGRTVAELMDLQRRTPARELERDHEEKAERPDRSGLPLNPESPDAVATADGRTVPLARLAPDRSAGTFGAQTVPLAFTAATLAGVNPTLAFPPDCMGAVGPSQFVVFVNGRLVTFNKNTGLADGVLNTDPDVFFAAVLNGSLTSDPRVRYDRLTGRWFLAIISVDTPNRILLAVSDGLANGAILPQTVFTFFFIDIAATPPAISSTCFADYPTLGLDANALYIGVNNFCGSPDQTFNGCDGYVVRKSSILGAGPIVVTAFRNLVSGGGAGPYTPQGVDNLDPAATEGYFIGVDNASFGKLMMRRVSDPGGTPSISSNLSITVPATNFPSTVPHLGNTGGAAGNLSALDDRLFAAHIRNGRLWTAHNIRVNNTGGTTGTLTRHASRWYELSVPLGSGTPTVAQSGTVFTPSATNSTDQRHWWIPSIMVSGQGHAAMGMGISGSAERANAAVVGRHVGDAPGTMQAGEAISGSTAAYNPPNDPGGSGGRRWGDYTYTSLDPLDDMTMWTVSMFTNATNSYGVRVAKLLAPPPATPASIADVTAGEANVPVTLIGTVASGSGFHDPGPDLPGAVPFAHLSATVLATGVTGTPPSVVSATWVNPTTVNLVLDASAATPSVGSERYTVRITNPDGQQRSAAILRVLPGAAVVTIGASTSLAEGNAGTTGFDFPVTLSTTAGSDVVVRYTTSDGTAAVADGDYIAETDSITIPAGQPGGTITIAANGDTRYEPDETFSVTLTSATDAELGATVLANGTILNDDTLPSLSVADTAGAETHAGTTTLTFTVELSEPLAGDVTASFATSDGSATLADADYAAAAGTVTVPAGDTVATFDVTVNGDGCGEPDESFTVTLSGVSVGAMLADSVAAGTIVNDDDATVPTVSVTAPNGGELLAIGTQASVTWTAGDDVGVTAVDVLLSRDGGATYGETLASGIPNLGSLDWTVTGPGTTPGQVFVRVIARDAGCNAATDSSDAGFQVSDPSVSAPGGAAVTAFALGRVMPNPTTGAVQVEFDLPREAGVRLVVLDTQGREIATLASGAFAPGRHFARWDGRGTRGPAAVGIYFVRYSVAGKSFTRRLALVR